MALTLSLVDFPFTSLSLPLVCGSPRREVSLGDKLNDGNILVYMVCKQITNIVSINTFGPAVIVRLHTNIKNIMFVCSLICCQNMISTIIFEETGLHRNEKCCTRGF